MSENKKVTKLGGKIYKTKINPPYQGEISMYLNYIPEVAFLEIFDYEISQGYSLYNFKTLKEIKIKK